MVKKSVTLLVFVLIVLSMGVVFAGSNDIVENDYDSIPIIIEMIENGVSRENAISIYNVGKLLDEKEKENFEYASDSEPMLELGADFISDFYEGQQRLNKEMMENPGQSSYRVEIGEDGWIESKTEIIFEGNPNLLSDSTILVDRIYSSTVGEDFAPFKNGSGNYTLRHTHTMSDGKLAYASSNIEEHVSVVANKSVEVEYVRGSGSAAGLIEYVGNENFIHIPKVVGFYNNNFCFVENKTNLRSRTSLSLGSGALSVGTSVGVDFFIQAIIKTSPVTVLYYDGIIV